MCVVLVCSMRIICTVLWYVLSCCNLMCYVMLCYVVLSGIECGTLLYYVALFVEPANLDL